MKPATYVKEFVHPDDINAVMEKIRTNVATADAPLYRQIEHRIVRRDGEVRHIVVRLRAIKNEEGKSVKLLGANQDVTESKRLEMALQQANTKLNLLAGITRHDVVNQMAVLNGSLGLIDERKLDERSQAFLDKARTAAGRIAKMVEFTREYEELGMCAPVWQDVRELICRGAEGVHLGQATICNDVPIGVEVFADPLIQKVFSNLMDNSVRHGGGVTRIRFSVEREDGRRSIVYEDDGVGLAPEIKEALFNKELGRDHGMGLFLSGKILSITDIKIAETGVPGQGVRFVLSVPAGGMRFRGAS